LGKKVNGEIDDGNEVKGISKINSNKFVEMDTPLSRVTMIDGWMIYSNLNESPRLHPLHQQQSGNFLPHPFDSHIFKLCPKAI
jgi:hypothetical protein